MSSEQPAANQAHYWQQHIDAWQTLGGTKAQYCRDNDLSYHVFIYWHTKFNGYKKPGKLVPVSVDRVSQSDDTGSLQLRLPNGIQITGIQTDSVDLVARLVSQL